MKRIIVFKIFIVLFFLSSCKYNTNNNKISNPLLPTLKIKSDLLKLAEDTISKWKSDSLNSAKYLYDFDTYILQDLVLNNDSTRMFTYAISIDTGYKHSVFDYQYDLGGAKINDKWYFFFGSSTVVDRATYQDSIYSPLTYDELSYLARKNLSGAFYQDENGDIKVRESFFDFMDDPNGWGLPSGSTRSDIDSVIVARNIEMHSRKIDPKEIEKIKAEMAMSVRPKEPIPDIKWYEKIFPKEKKLFETDEWKEYVRSKNQEK